MENLDNERYVYENGVVTEGTLKHVDSPSVTAGKLVQAVTRPTCIRQMSNSNLGRDSG
jgi:hypothetical protein